MNWKRKLSSRKFWMALALFVSGLVLASGGKQEVADTIFGCIMQGAAVIAYIVAEGLVDQENAQYYTPKHAPEEAGKDE